MDTAITLYPSGTPTDYGNAATFTAVVTAADETPTGGVVSMWEGLFEIAEATLVNGVADFSVENLPALTHPNLTAKFEGSMGFNASETAAPATHTVVPRPDTAVVTLDAGGSAAPYGQPLLLVATVSGLNRPGGTVTFYDATSTLGTAEVMPTGTARFVADNLAVGTHTLRASYSGDVNNQGSFVSGDVAFTVPPPAGNIYIVDRADDVYDTVSHTCSAAANDCSLREAVYWANLNPGSVILFGPTGRIDVASSGPDDDLNEVGDLDITASMTIKGNGWQPDNMTGTGSNWVTCNNYSRCFDIHSGANVIMTGFVIVNGRAEFGLDHITTPTNGESGGGIRHRGASLLLSNMGFKYNSAGKGGNSLDVLVQAAHGGRGGAIYAEAPLRVYTSRVEGNYGGDGGNGSSSDGDAGDAGDGGQGGGFYCSSLVGCTSMLILDSHFESNQPGSGGQGGDSVSNVGGDGGLGGYGGALAGDGDFLVENSIFQNNQAGSGGRFGMPVNSGGYYGDGGGGGGIYFAGGVLQIEDSYFYANYGGGGSENALGNGGNGGAIYADGGSWINLNIYRATFKNNMTGNTHPSGLGGTSGNGGALYINGDVELDVANSSFYGNSAGNPQNSNQGGNGGAIYYNLVTPTGFIRFSTFANNQAGMNWSNESYNGTGGHFYFNTLDPGATLTIAASILTDGVASSTNNYSGSQCTGNTYSFVSGGYNLLGNLTGCALTPLASDHVLTGFEGSGVSGMEDMGGPIPVVYLNHDSQAMNLVPYGEADCGTNILTDARGMSRQQGSACEAGAYEQGMPVGFTILSGHNQRKTTGTDFDALASKLLDEIGGGLHSIAVTATCPAGGASCYFNSNPSSLIQTYNSYNSSTMMGHTYFGPKANPTSGSYTVLITAYPATTTFTLTNTLGTTLALTLDPNPSTYGQSVAMIATITPSAATGTIYYYESAALLGSADLSDGTATFNTSTLTVGTHAVTATYYGGGVYNGSTSSSRSQAVNKVTSTLTLASELNPSTYGQAVSLTASISPVEATGSVAFFDGATSLGSAVLSGGTAVLTISTLTVGTHTVTGTYAGDANSSSAISNEVSQVVNQATSTVSLTSTPNPSTYGDLITLTATVSPAGATGTVEFFNGAVSLGSAALSGGTATLTNATLEASTHSLTAVYSGETRYTGSTSDVASQAVHQAASTAALGSSLNPSTYGQSVTFTATVTPSIATGTVEFFSDGTSLGSGTLTSGTASLSASLLDAGTHTIRAAYSGNGNYLPATTSVDLIQTVNKASSTIALDSSLNPSKYNQNVSFTATVTPSTATGTVAFFDGLVSLGTETLSGGVATLTSSLLAVGTYTIHAAYSGNGSYEGSTTMVDLIQTVNKAATTVTVESSANPAEENTSVLFTASVLPSAATGTVEFFEGAVSLGTRALTVGTATLAISTLSVGTHTLTAVYGGNAVYETSTSTGLVEEIYPSAITTTLSLESTPNPSTYGQTVTLTAALSPAGATGTVDFFEGATLLGSGTLSGGMATLNIASLVVGTHTVTATYLGAGIYQPSTAPAILQTVSKGVVTVTLTGPASSTIYGQSAAFRVTVSAVLGTPAGTVELYEGATLLGSGALAGGTATIQVSSLNAGLHSLTASYTGSATHATATSSLATHTVGKADTLTSLENVPAEVRVGEAVTIEVSVTAVAPGAGAPAGTVTISADDGTSCNTTVAAGSCELTFTTDGSKTITATYHAAANFKGSVSLVEVIAVVLQVKIFMPLIIVP